MEKESIGQRIRKLRKSKKLTQAQLAKIAGVSSPAVTEWEKDSYLPKAAPLNAIAEYFSVSTEYILFGQSQNQKQDFQSQRLFDHSAPSPEVKNLIDLLTKLDSEHKLSKEVIQHLKNTLDIVTKRVGKESTVS